MKVFFGKTIIILGVLLGFINIQQVLGQQKAQYMSACNIFDNLVFGLRFKNSIDEINKLLINQIKERKVDFTLNSDEEKAFKRIGASDLLIKAIHENYSKTLQEQISLYKKFTDNYNGTLEQKKIALEAAKMFVEKFSGDADYKDIIEYFRNNIPAMEKYLNEIKNIDKDSNLNKF
jgi:hypothetical protein